MVVCCAGEFPLRLRQLEKSLLQALNDAKGKILDDDSVITTLETLKQEAADISKKVEETDKVIAEIETVSQQYMPLSQVRGSLTTSGMTFMGFEVFAFVWLRVLLSWEVTLYGRESGADVLKDCSGVLVSH